MNTPTLRALVMNESKPELLRVESESLVERAYAALQGCGDAAARIAAAARLILAIFDDFYSLLCEYPVPSEVRVRAHGPAYVDPHQQGALESVQPLHL